VFKSCYDYLRAKCRMANRNISLNSAVKRQAKQIFLESTILLLHFLQEYIQNKIRTFLQGLLFITNTFINHTLNVTGLVLALQVRPSAILTFKNRASYIYDGRTATLRMLHFIYFFNKYKYWVPAGPTTNTARLSPRYKGKTRGCHYSHWAPDDGRENARNMLSCKQTSG
jgi:hypothetical protein